MNDDLYIYPRFMFWWKRAITLWWPWRKEPRVYIPRSYLIAKPLDLVRAHEGAHVTQWFTLGRLGFIWKYLHINGRLDIEAEAFADSIRWWRMRDPRALPATGETWPYHFALIMKDKYGMWGVSKETCQRRIEYYLAEAV